MRKRNNETNAFAQRAVWQDGGLVSSEILFNFASALIVPAAVKAATSPSCWLDVAQFAPLIALHRGGSRVANRFANSAQRGGSTRWTKPCKLNTCEIEARPANPLERGKFRSCARHELGIKNEKGRIITNWIDNCNFC